MVNPYIVDRGLEYRSKLVFCFPMLSDPSRLQKVILPHFEDVDIREQQSSHLSKYVLLGRSSNLFTYVGSDSREFRLGFNFTLPHIEDAGVPKVFNTIVGTGQNTSQEQGKFLQPTIPKEPISNANKHILDFLKNIGGGSIKSSVQGVINHGKDFLSQRDIEDLRFRYGLGPTTINQDYGATTYFTNGDDQKIINMQQQRSSIIDLIMYWVNIIRTSTITNSKNPTLGPPIVRLTHGLMYQDIPCVCSNYNIERNLTAGFDLHTLLPRQLHIGMTLHEVRTGDYTVYNPTHPIRRDNLAGWEAVIEDYGSMDPGFGNG